MKVTYFVFYIRLFRHTCIYKHITILVIMQSKFKLINNFKVKADELGLSRENLQNK